MISYFNPVCPTTESKASIFCYNENCTQPAFGCSVDCFGMNGHKNHRKMWIGSNGYLYSDGV